MIYKTISFLENPSGYTFFDREFNDVFDENPINIKTPPKKNNENNYNLKFLTNSMNQAYQKRDIDQMDQALSDLIQLSQETEILYSFEIIKYKIKSILYSCLEYDSPYNLMTKTLKLISQILQQKNEKVFGESFISDDDDSISLIEILFHLARHFLEKRLEEENEEKYFTLAHILICLNLTSTFNIEASELILNLFFKNEPYLIRDIIDINSSESSFSQFINLLKFCSCKLICNLTQMKINAYDAENLFVFVCKNWKSVFNSSEKQMNDAIISFSMKNLIRSVYNFIKLTPDKWSSIFLSCDAWSLVESCLVNDNIEIATPAVKCVLQLLVQNASIEINYGYFIDLLQSYREEESSQKEDSIQPPETANETQQQQTTTNSISFQIENSIQPSQTTNEIQQQQPTTNSISFQIENSIQPLKTANEIQQQQTTTNSISFQIENSIQPSQTTNEIQQGQTTTNQNSLQSQTENSIQPSQMLEDSIKKMEIPFIENSIEWKPNKIESSEKTFDNFISLACYSIEFMIAQNKEHAQNLVSANFFNTIASLIENIPYKLVSECISCICSVINSHIINGLDSILEANIIELLVDFSLGRLNSVLLLQVINALHQIFHIGIINGRQMEVLERFDNSDGNDAMKSISNDDNQIVNDSLQSFFKTYESIQNQPES